MKLFQYEERDSHSNKIVRVKCEYCGKERDVTDGNYRNSQNKRKNEKTPCKPCAMKYEAAEKRRGVPSPLKGRQRPDMTGDKNPNFKGFYITSDGYKQVYLGKRKYRGEHRLVVEASIGRPLLKKEIVHHINGDTLDNRIENLILLPNEAKHKGIHASSSSVLKSFIQQGLITFDTESLTYQVAHIKLRELLEHLEEGNQHPS